MLWLTSLGTARTNQGTDNNSNKVFQKKINSVYLLRSGWFHLIFVIQLFLFPSVRFVDLQFVHLIRIKWQDFKNFYSRQETKKLGAPNFLVSCHFLSFSVLKFVFSFLNNFSVKWPRIILQRLQQDWLKAYFISFLQWITHLIGILYEMKSKPKNVIPMSHLMNGGCR
jgi:hypothetical protein